MRRKIAHEIAMHWNVTNNNSYTRQIPCPFTITVWNPVRSWLQEHANEAMFMRPAMLVMMLKRCPVHWHHLTSSCVAQSAKRHNLVTPMSRGGSPKPHGPWITPSDTWKRTCKSCLESGPACRPSTPDWAWTRRACCLYAWLYRALVIALLLSVLAVSLTLPSNAAWAQSNAPGVEARALAERLNFFRWLEDYSDVSEAQRAESFYARIKRIPLVSEQPYPYLSLGGNYRFRYEYFSNGLFGLVSPEETTVGL
jgi:hypothetical protein